MGQRIKTKQIGDKWYSLDTIDGYDYSFEGDSINHAQAQMKAFLRSRGKKVVRWEKPEYYIKEIPQKKSPFGNRIKIDYL